MTPFSPTKDDLITERYAVGTLEKKLANKTAAQAAWGWVKEPKRPMLCLPCGMSDALGGAVFKELLPGLLLLDVELVVLGKGSAEYGALFTKLAKDHPHRVKILKNEEESLHTMLAASDMALFLSESNKEAQHCLGYGVVPVSVHSPFLADYNPVQESGNSFLITGDTKWHAFAGLVRAMETFKFPYDWRTIQRHCMESAA